MLSSALLFYRLVSHRKLTNSLKAKASRQTITEPKHFAEALFALQQWHMVAVEEVLLLRVSIHVNACKINANAASTQRTILSEHSFFSCQADIPQVLAEAIVSLEGNKDTVVFGWLTSKLAEISRSSEQATSSSAAAAMECLCILRQSWFSNGMLIETGSQLLSSSLRHIAENALPRATTCK